MHAFLLNNNLRHSEKANGIIELLLFAPLAIIFLFVSIDAGLAYSERAAITNAIRAGLNTEIISNSRTAILRFTGTDFELHEFHAPELVDNLSQAIGHNILRAQGLRNESDAKHFHVQVYLVQFDIEPDDGSLRSFNLTKYHSMFPSNSGAHIHLLASDASQDDVMTFLGKRFEHERSQIPSSLAVPLSPSLNLETAGSVGVRFLPQTYALVAEVVALTRGVAPQLTSSLLGKFYSHKEFQFSVIRTQFH